MTRTIIRERIIGWKDVKTATEIEAVRLAMLIDTEGSISPLKCVDYYVPKIKVGMTDEMVIKMVWKWGGLIFKRIPKNVKHKTVYVWELTQREEIRDFLEAIKSKLMIKKKQAEFSLYMCDVLAAKKPGWKKATNLSAKKIQKLNHSPSPNIDLKKLEAISKMNVERKLKEFVALLLQAKAKSEDVESMINT